MKKILFVGAEVMPFAATGGLGDVMGSLPAAIKAKEKNNVDVRVVLPLYGVIKDEWREQMKEEIVFSLNLAWRNLYCGIKSLEKDGVTYYFIDNEYYFKRGALYGFFRDVKAQWAHQVQAAAGSGTGTGDVAAVLGNLRFHQHNIQHFSHAKTL